MLFLKQRKDRKLLASSATIKAHSPELIQDSRPSSLGFT
jgi:hypothetical protein